MASPKRSPARKPGGAARRAPAKAGPSAKTPPRAPPPPPPTPDAPLLVSNFSLRGGRDDDLAALGNLLAHEGLTAPHNGQPWSEAMLLGLGGGLSFGQRLVPLEGRVHGFLTRRAHDHATTDGIVGEACRRLALKLALKESGGAREGERQLRAGLGAGHPVLCWGDRATFGHHALPVALRGVHVHVFVVFGHDPQHHEALVAERSRQPFVVDTAELADARSAIGAMRQRSLWVKGAPRRFHLGKAVHEAITACIARLGQSKPRGAGLSGMPAWADQIAGAKDRKGWPALLANQADLLAVLTGMFDAIEGGAGGGAHRALYADFLDEAREVLDRPALGSVAQHYRALGRQWSQLARAMLPDTIPVLQQVRELLVRQTRLYELRGPDSLVERQAIRDELAGLAADIARRPLVDAAQLTDLLEGLSSRVRALHEAEMESLASLTGAIR